MWSPALNVKLLAFQYTDTTVICYPAYCGVKLCSVLDNILLLQWYCSSNAVEENQRINKFWEKTMFCSIKPTFILIVVKRLNKVFKDSWNIFREKLNKIISILHHFKILTNLNNEFASRDFFGPFFRQTKFFLFLKNLTSLGYSAFSGIAHSQFLSFLHTSLHTH